MFIPSFWFIPPPSPENSYLLSGLEPLKATPKARSSQITAEARANWRLPFRHKAQSCCFCSTFPDWPLLKQGWNGLQSLCIMREKRKLPVWKAFFFLRGLEYFWLTWVSCSRARGFWWKWKRNPAQQNFRIRWSFSSFREGVRAAEEHRARGSRGDGLAGSDGAWMPWWGMNEAAVAGEAGVSAAELAHLPAIGTAPRARIWTPHTQRGHWVQGEALKSRGCRKPRHPETTTSSPPAFHPFILEGKSEPWRHPAFLVVTLVCGAGGRRGDRQETTKEVKYLVYPVALMLRRKSQQGSQGAGHAGGHRLSPVGEHLSPLWRWPGLALPKRSPPGRHISKPAAFRFPLCYVGTWRIGKGLGDLFMRHQSVL